MRKGINQTGEPVGSGKASDKGNSELYNEREGLFGTWQRISIPVAIAIVLFGVVMREVSPTFYKQHEKKIDRVTYLADTTVDIIKKFVDIPWSDLRKIEGLGHHPEFKTLPKKKFFFAGGVFQTKDYIREIDTLNKEELDKIEDQIKLKIPLTNITWDEADQICKSLGEGYRLPSYKELKRGAELYDAYQLKNADPKKTKINLRVNIKDVKYFESKALWTMDQEGDGYYTEDNFRVFKYKSKLDEAVYLDNEDSNDELGFKCVKEPKERKKKEQAPVETKKPEITDGEK